MAQSPLRPAAYRPDAPWPSTPAAPAASPTLPWNQPTAGLPFGVSGVGFSYDKEMLSGLKFTTPEPAHDSRSQHNESQSSGPARVAARDHSHDGPNSGVTQHVGEAHHSNETATAASHDSRSQRNTSQSSGPARVAERDHSHDGPNAGGARHVGEAHHGNVSASVAKHDSRSQHNESQSSGPAQVAARDHSHDDPNSGVTRHVGEGHQHNDSQSSGPARVAARDHGQDDAHSGFNRNSAAAPAVSYLDALTTAGTAGHGHDKGASALTAALANHMQQHGMEGEARYHAAALGRSAADFLAQPHDGQSVLALHKSGGVLAGVYGQGEGPQQAGDPPAISAATLAYVHDHGLPGQGLDVVRQALGEESRGLSDLDIVNKVGGPALEKWGQDGLSAENVEKVQTAINFTMGGAGYDVAASKLDTLQVMSDMGQHPDNNYLVASKTGDLTGVMTLDQFNQHSAAQGYSGTVAMDLASLKQELSMPVSDRAELPPAQAVEAKATVAEAAPVEMTL